MKISSFDIFDTCLLRKCGTPQNFFDVFSLHAFNGEVEEWARQEFVAARVLTEKSLWEKDPYYTLNDIWDAFEWEHPSMKNVSELCELERELECEMLVPVLKMRDKVNECRNRGDKIVFISDMYLSSVFLVEVMQKHGFFQERDSLYVSCECKAAKYDGGLFQYVKNKEGLKSYRRWHHYGDNKQGDYNAPRKLGIKATLINHAYTPYQRQWLDNDYSLGFKYPGVIAGISRALRYSTEWTSHTDFVLDIIAPFYCSWIYQVLADAQKRGIKRLYFCARDAYQIHKIALAMQSQFPEVGVEYVYISRVALYKEDNVEAKLAYYKQIGLASQTYKVAIVDTTTSGKTLMVLNEFLKSNGCNEVTAYYYLLWNKVDGVDREKYNVRVYDQYVYQNARFNRLLDHLFVFENFFGLSKDKKTIDYTFDKRGTAVPVFTDQLLHEDCKIIDSIDWISVHEKLLVLYAQEYLKMGLGDYARQIFESIGNATVSRFFARPEKQYLSALEDFYFLGNMNDDFYPCIKRIVNPLELMGGKRKYYWRRGSIYYTLPKWLTKIILLIKHE